MSTEYNWINTKAKISITCVDAEITDVPLELVNKFTSSPNTPFTPIHGFSNGEFNAGMARNVNSVTWNMTIPANSSSARLLRALKVAKYSFDMTVENYEGAADKGDFELRQEVYNGCRVTDQSAGYEIDGIPQITFNGIALTLTMADETDDHASWTFGDGINEKSDAIAVGLLTDDIW